MDEKTKFRLSLDIGNPGTDLGLAGEIPASKVTEFWTRVENLANEYRVDNLPPKPGDGVGVGGEGQMG